MSAKQYVYYELSPEVLDDLGLPRLPFPVRRNRVENIFVAEQVDFSLILEELDRFVNSHPESGAMYRTTIAVLAYMLAIRAGAMGETKKADELLSLGIRHQPENTGLRVNHAFSLHMLGRYDEAISQYRELISETGNSPDFLIHLLAARALGDSGDPKSAYEMLMACPAELAKDADFGRLLDHYRHQIDEIKPNETDQSSIEHETAAQPPVNFCRQCGNRLRAGVKFCTDCGKAIPS